MVSDLAAIVEECLQRLDRGENLPQVLEAFPDLQERLKPYLLVAMASRTFPMPIPSQTAQRLGRNQMLAEMNRLEIKKAFRKKPEIPLTSRLQGKLAELLHNGGYNKLAYSYRLAILSLVLILSGGFLTLNASAASQPGEVMYQVKQNLKRVGLVWLMPARNQQPETNQINQPDFSFDVPSGSDQAIWMDPEVGFPPGNPLGGDSLSSGPADNHNPAELDGIASDQDQIKSEKEAEKEQAAVEREAQKEQAAAEREVQKELAAAEREAEKVSAAGERQAEQELAAAERAEAKELKAAEKESSPNNAKPAAGGKKGEKISKPGGGTNKDKKK